MSNMSGQHEAKHSNIRVSTNEESFDRARAGAYVAAGRRSCCAGDAAARRKAQDNGHAGKRGNVRTQGNAHSDFKRTGTESVKARPAGAACGNVRPVGAARASSRTGGLSAKRKVALVLSALVVCVCLGAVGVILWGYNQGSQAYDSLAKTALPAESAMEETPLSTRIDWDALLAVNPETIAWVYVPGTSINYPIVQTSDNQKYIKTDFQGETNWAVSYGAIFLDTNCEANLTSQNSFFYGHNMNNGAMFAPLASFADNATFNDHRVVYLFTPTCNYKLQSFALLHVAASSTLVQLVTGSAVHQRAYVQTQIDQSVVTPEEGFPDAGLIDRTYAFATCDNLPSNGRYVLFCRAEEMLSLS